MCDEDLYLCSYRQDSRSFDAVVLHQSLLYPSAQQQSRAVLGAMQSCEALRAAAAVADDASIEAHAGVQYADT